MHVKIQETVSSKAKTDIVELEQKIEAFTKGQIPEDKFKHFRLTRGVYGQRQFGVQMVRIKLPYGKVTAEQLIAIANASNKFATGNLHLTTRQDIQLHFVKVNDTPQLWADLEAFDVTLREACGNTVRNVTASAIAGIDPKEPFDVSPYAHAFAHYFMRNPICQDMGRKIKVAFSSSDEDSGLTFMHDIGFIPRIKEIDGKPNRGFKVVVGGGLGAQAILAQTAHEFLPEDQMIPFSEAVLRVFDRHGERTKRFKARLKFLIQSIGLEEFLKLVEAEKKALKNQTYTIELFDAEKTESLAQKQTESSVEVDETPFLNWKSTNVFEQKQTGFYGVYIRVPLGDIHADKARNLAEIVKKYAANDIRVTVNQGLVLKFVKSESLSSLFFELNELGLALPGFDSIHDITACPGSDTCNLAVTNSTALATELEKVLKEEYADLIHETKIKVKISGCMNSCGQHMIANIGFHGSSIKNGTLTAPAMQVVLGGGFDTSGNGIVAEKVVKIPSKKIPDVLRLVLDDYYEKSNEGEYFNSYFQRQGKMYFYHLLKPLADTALLTEADYIDWGSEKSFSPEIGVGECAGISLDVIGTVIGEAEEKLNAAQEAFAEQSFADAIYNAYSSFVIGAKALLLSIDHQCNTQIGILNDFDEKFVNTGIFSIDAFSNLVLRINQNEPTEIFATRYLKDAVDFFNQVVAFRQKQLTQDATLVDKKVVDRHYKA